MLIYINLQENRFVCSTSYKHSEMFYLIADLQRVVLRVTVALKETLFTLSIRSSKKNTAVTNYSNRMCSFLRVTCTPSPVCSVNFHPVT